jgi:E3 ubiquitin-protein ligase SHPRH
VKEIEQTLVGITAKINPKISMHREGTWWREILDTVSAEAPFIYRLYFELRNANVLGMESFNSKRSLDLYLLLWWDKVWNYRTKLMNALDKIRFFTTDLRPKHEMSLQQTENISQLVQNAFECHLNEEFLSEKEDERMKKLKKTNRKTPALCEMCKINRILNEYECVIFKKTLIEIEGNTRTEGNWNASAQELVLRYMENYSKKEKLGDHIIKKGVSFLEMLDNVKEEFKQLSQYFVEINYTVAAFDELSMCKVRLQVLTKDEYDQLPVQSNNHILQGLVDSQEQQMLLDKREAEMKFARLQGTLKYLHHLSDEKTVEMCPICQQLPEEKYSVLECGHLICLICFMDLRKSTRAYTTLSCPVCRNIQKFKE